MESMLHALNQVWETFREIWPYLLLSVFISAAMRQYVSGERIKQWVQKYRGTSILAATSIAVSTPLCSCGGGIAVALSMMAASLPWGPLVAFIIASPLTSPDEVMYSAGLFGWPFALTYFVAAASAGITGGLLAHSFEKKGWLVNQARFHPPAVETCCSPESQEHETCCTPQRSVLERGKEQVARLKTVAYLREMGLVSRRLLLTFLVASFLGNLVGNILPTTWISSLFGSGRGWSVPLGAILGIPFSLNISSSLPLARTLLAHGATPGAAMAFLLVGAGTSLGALAGLLTIARWRIVLLVMCTLLPLAIIFGSLYDAFIALRIL